MKAQSSMFNTPESSDRYQIKDFFSNETSPMSVLSGDLRTEVRKKSVLFE